MALFCVFAYKLWYFGDCNSKKMNIEAVIYKSVKDFKGVKLFNLLNDIVFIRFFFKSTKLWSLTLTLSDAGIDLQDISLDKRSVKRNSKQRSDFLFYFFCGWISCCTKTWTMFCCGGAEEENAGPPANQNTAPPRGNNPVGGNLLLYLCI